MLSFLKKIFERTTSQTPATSFQTPQTRQLSDDQRQALDVLLQGILAHFGCQKAETTASKVRQIFIEGETLSTAIKEAVENSESQVYLSVDINDPESAAGFAQDLCIAHGIATIDIDFDNRTVPDVLEEFDLWVSKRDYRLVINRDVDWAYEAILLPLSKVRVVIESAHKLKINLGLGVERDSEHQS